MQMCDSLPFQRCLIINMYTWYIHKTADSLELNVSWSAYKNHICVFYVDFILIKINKPEHGENTLFSKVQFNAKKNI